MRCAPARADEFPVDFPLIRENGPNGRRASSAKDSLHRQKSEMGPLWPRFFFQQRVREENPVRQNRVAILDARSAPRRGELAKRANQSHPLHQETERPPCGAFLFPGRARYGFSDLVRRAQRRSRLPGRDATIPPSPPASQAFEESRTRDCRRPFSFRGL